MPMRQNVYARNKQRVPVVAVAARALAVVAVVMVVPHADHRVAVAAVVVVVREYEDLKVALGLMRKR